MFNSAQFFAGRMLERSDEFQGFLSLRSLNDSLIDENTKLLERVKRFQVEAEFSLDSLTLPPLLAEEVKSVLNIAGEEVENAINVEGTSLNVLAPIVKTDSISEVSKRSDIYRFIGAKVINNSIYRSNNFITINKGSLDGIEPEMGVIGRNGLVGVVKDVSTHFSTIVSLLHKGTRVSAKFKSSNYRGDLTWKNDPEYAVLGAIGKHREVMLNDTVVTSGYSAFFPEGVVIGYVKEWNLSKGSNFYDISVKLATDFAALNYVYVIDYRLKGEQKELEFKTKNE